MTKDEEAVAEVVQLALDLPKVKQKRHKKRGRKKTGRCSDSPHRRRPEHRKALPVHVLLRTLKSVPRLRQAHVYRAARAALLIIAAKHAFRVVHMSIQHNHLHFLVEADDRIALSRGMQSLAISLARRINRSCKRTGKVFAHRFYEKTITTPRQARHALAYVLNNWRHHREDLGSPRARAAKIDPYSTGLAFDGWREVDRFDVPEGFEPLRAARPETWLLTVGWRRHPKVSCFEMPR